MAVHKQHHTVVHCVPLPRQEGEVAPMYFKVSSGAGWRPAARPDPRPALARPQNAIAECDTQWSQHPKLIDTRAKGLRRCVPKGFAYFNVAFGLDGGFAHVIEDEELFPRHFGLVRN